MAVNMYEIKCVEDREQLKLNSYELAKAYHSFALGCLDYQAAEANLIRAADWAVKAGATSLEEEINADLKALPKASKAGAVRPKLEVVPNG